MENTKAKKQWKNKENLAEVKITAESQIQAYLA
jgi:hypothetical protein